MQLRNLGRSGLRVAPLCLGGESETVIGNWLQRRGRRDEVVIATKVGMQMAPDRKGLEILRALDDVAKRQRSSPASVALAWQIALPSIAAPIASATAVEQLNELVAATRLNLSASDIEQLNAASA